MNLEGLWPMHAIAYVDPVNCKYMYWGRFLFARLIF